jgi:hypothetical protein
MASVNSGSSAGFNTISGTNTPVAQPSTQSTAFSAQPNAAALAQNPTNQITNPSASGGSSGGSGTGPGGISKGSYNPASLTQDQRQWLWNQFGHTGTAPVGYGGESTTPAGPVSTGNQITKLAPMLPTTAAPSASMVPTKGVSGATTTPSAVGTQGGGGVGQAFGLPNAATKATGGLQLPGLPSNILSQLSSGVQGIGNNIGSFLSSLGGQPSATQGQQPATALKSVVSNIGQDVSQVGNQIGQGMAQLTKNAQQNLGQSGSPAQDLQSASGPAPTLGKGLTGQPPHPGSWTIPGLNIPINDVGISEIIHAMVSPGWQTSGSLHNPIAYAALNTPAMGTKNALQNYSVKPGAQGASPTLGSTAMSTGTSASEGALQGNITDPNQVKQVLQGVSQGSISPQQAASAITNQQAPAAINQAIDVAQKSGDMQAVGRLSQLGQAVNQQLQLINQIGAQILGIAQGYGPQSSQLTAARMPMIQQGVGQALTGQTPNQLAAAQMPSQQGSQIPYMPPTLQTATPNQQNTPVLKPFMGA